MEIDVLKVKASEVADLIPIKCEELKEYKEAPGLGKCAFCGEELKYYIDATEEKDKIAFIVWAVCDKCKKRQFILLWYWPKEG